MMIVASEGMRKKESGDYHVCCSITDGGDGFCTRANYRITKHRRPAIIPHTRNISTI
jgi:hypothetical protein